jgi:pimeloyl-ACP methyl ester carboxylesterase
MSFEELALDIKNYIDIHKLNNIILLGHSFGGRNIFGYL